MVEGDDVTRKVSNTRSSRGHCEAISQVGMKLSFVGTRFSEAKLSRPGCLLSVTVQLPNGPINALVSTVNCNRPARAEGNAKWILSLGVTFYQMSDRDTARLGAYLVRRAAEQTHLAVEG